MTPESTEGATPPLHITIVELGDIARARPTVSGKWPNKSPIDDQIAICVSDSLIVKGTPDQYRAWLGQQRLAVDAVERELLAERVAEARADVRFVDINAPLHQSISVFGTLGGIEL